MSSLRGRNKGWQFSESQIRGRWFLAGIRRQATEAGSTAMGLGSRLAAAIAFHFHNRLHNPMITAAIFRMREQTPSRNLEDKQHCYGDAQHAYNRRQLVRIVKCAKFQTPRWE
jgi:hypothetical protein